jgi:hypothetical protein
MKTTDEVLKMTMKANIVWKMLMTERLKITTEKVSMKKTNIVWIMPMGK